MKLSVSALCVLGTLSLVAGCESDSLKPPVAPAAEALYWDLLLDHHAVTLSTTSPYDTLSITATPRNYLGEPIVGLPAPQYVSTDLEKVAVTPAGTLVAVAPTSQPVKVRATLTVGNLKHQDSVFIKVVNDPAPPVLASLSIDPIPPDSAKTAAGTGTGSAANNGGPKKTLLVQATDALGAAFPSLLVNFRSSDSTIAGVDPLNGDVSGLRPGSVNLYASATAFGVRKMDTLFFRIGWPLKVSVGTGNPSVGGVVGRFAQPEAWVGAGAVIGWAVHGMGAFDLFSKEGVEFKAVDITFNDADLPKISAADMTNPIVAGFDLSLHCGFRADCGGGNAVVGGGVLSFSSLSFPMWALRVFSVPGTYEYRSQLHGTSGRIVVVDER